MKFRNVLATVGCAALLTINCSAIDLVVDGEKLNLDVPPQVVEQRTLVPLRAIFEKLGATVEWDQSTQTATATNGTDEVRITLNSTTAYVNGEAEVLDVPAMAVDGRTLVPVRFVSEALDAQVEWLQDTQTVRITTSSGAGSGTTEVPATPAPTPTPAPAPTPTSTPSPAPSAEHKIYVTKTGKRYHYDPSCNGGTYYESTLAQAEARGLTPCQKCVH